MYLPNKWIKSLDSKFLQNIRFLIGIEDYIAMNRDIVSDEIHSGFHPNGRALGQ